VGNLPIVKLLISGKTEKSGHLALHAGVREGHANVVQYLLEKGESPNGIVGRMFDETFLGIAASNGSEKIVNLLIQHGANIKNALSANNKRFRTEYDELNARLYGYSDEARVKKMQYCPDSYMEKWDRDKKDLIERRDALLRKYSRSVQIISDHSVGANLNPGLKHLSFLKEIDVPE